MSDTGRTLSGDEGISMMPSVTAGRAGGSEAVGNGDAQSLSVHLGVGLGFDSKSAWLQSWYSWLSL